MINKTPEQVSREFYEKSLEKLEQDSKRNCVISGSVCVALGLVVIGMSFSAAVYSTRRPSQIIGLLIIFLGIFFFTRKKIEKTRRNLLKDENSWLFKRKQSVMEKKQNRWRRKAGHHPSLKYEATRRFKILAGTITGVMFLLTFLCLIADDLSRGLIIIDVVCVICFALTFLARGHKKLLRQYLEYGLDETAAEEDFKNSKLYKKYASVSRRFITLLDPPSVVPADKIVWVFPKVCYVYHYMNCVYCGIVEKYSLNIYDEDGRYYSQECPEEVCRILIDDICEAGTSVTAGFSQELFELYSQSPYNFRNAVKNFTLPSPYQMPPNEIK